MTSKTPVRSCEDVDETALSYAEIKALATGNPLILEKCQMEADVGKLKLLYSSHKSQQYDLEYKILKEYPQEIKRLQEHISGYQESIKIADAHPVSKDHFPPMTIGGILYADKKDAGNAIIEACKLLNSPDPVPLGEYRGFKMTLSYDTFNKKYCIALKGPITHFVQLSDDIHGNIIRLDNALESFHKHLQDCETRLENVSQQMETAKGELDILLNMDEKDSVLLDMEPDEADAETAAPKRKDRGMER